MLADVQCNVPVSLDQSECGGVALAGVLRPIGYVVSVCVVCQHRPLLRLVPRVPGSLVVDASP